MKCILFNLEFTISGLNKIIAKSIDCNLVPEQLLEDLICHLIKETCLFIVLIQLSQVLDSVKKHGINYAKTFLTLYNACKLNFYKNINSSLKIHYKRKSKQSSINCKQDLITIKYSRYQRKITKI